MKRMVLAGMLVVTLAGCGIDPPHEGDSRFTDMQVNGTRCIIYTPSSGSATGTTMQCDFAGYVPATSEPPIVPAGPPIDDPALSPPPTEEVPVPPTEEVPAP